MQRRKMLAALGSVAIGGATAAGTGAFTSVSADRSVSVEVTGVDVEVMHHRTTTSVAENGE